MLYRIHCVMSFRFACIFSMAKFDSFGFVFAGCLLHVTMCMYAALLVNIPNYAVTITYNGNQFHQHDFNEKDSFTIISYQTN